MKQRLEDSTSHYDFREMNLLYLPDEVVRHIFSFLSDAKLYFDVRGVCRQLRSLVEDYVHIGM